MIFLRESNPDESAIKIYKAYAFCVLLRAGRSVPRWIELDEPERDVWRLFAQGRGVEW